MSIYNLSYDIIMLNSPRQSGIWGCQFRCLQLTKSFQVLRQQTFPSLVHQIIESACGNSLISLFAKWHQELKEKKRKVRGSLGLQIHWSTCCLQRMIKYVAKRFSLISLRFFLFAFVIEVAQCSWAACKNISVTRKFTNF